MEFYHGGKIYQYILEYSAFKLDIRCPVKMITGINNSNLSFKRINITKVEAVAEDKIPLYVSAKLVVVGDNEVQSLPFYPPPKQDVPKIRKEVKQDVKKEEKPEKKSFIQQMDEEEIQLIELYLNISSEILDKELLRKRLEVLKNRRK